MPRNRHVTVLWAPIPFGLFCFSNAFLCGVLNSNRNEHSFQKQLKKKTVKQHGDPQSLKRDKHSKLNNATCLLANEKNIKHKHTKKNELQRQHCVHRFCGCSGNSKQQFFRAKQVFISLGWSKVTWQPQQQQRQQQAVAVLQKSRHFFGSN